ncbi:dynein regulatory complex protein 9-like [Anticarsia gemmatalis]|uniref:dynein regulatory complex protein 9-like n=1 Tax=Anticarsia gemmatalis TaxID=129554 RepID=UPI003F7590BA
MGDFIMSLKLRGHGKHHRTSNPDEDAESNVDTMQFSSELSVKKARIDGSKIESQISESSEKPCLSYFQATLFATIFEHTAVQLRILAECNSELRIIKTMSDMETLLRDKYAVVKRPRDPLDGIDVKKLEDNKYKLDKLAADRKLCNEVIINTYLDLALKGCFAPLSDINSEIVGRYKYYDILVEDEARNKCTRRDVLKQLRQQRNHFKSVTYDTDLIIEKLKSQVEDAALVSETKSRYIDNWQVARTEQNHQFILDKESGPSDEIKYFRQRFDHEQRVHSEVELLTNINITEALNKVDFWMDKYDKDMEALDLKIQLMKNQYQSQTDVRKEMEETIEKHGTEMQNWIDFKDAREKDRLYRLKMNTAAIVVQAWWRGLLVRLELGPYRPVKKKGGAAGGKKKK